MIDSKNFTGPNPGWHEHASVVYFKDKLYYLGGRYINRYTYKDTNQVDVRRPNESP